MELPSVVRCVGLNLYPPTCLVGLGERNQGFHVENPRYLGINADATQHKGELHTPGLGVAGVSPQTAVSNHSPISD
jgi:hypothetical protein